jgi:hypothetical protein
LFWRGRYVKTGYLKSETMKKLFSFLMIAICTCFLTGEFVFAQTQAGKLDGKWEVEPSDKHDGKDLQFQLRSSKFQGDDNWSFSEQLSKSELAGYAEGKDVVFNLKRHAGTIKFSGNVANDNGDGTFTFTPDNEYVKALANYGYSLNAHELLLFAFKNQSIDYIRQLNTLGYKDVSENNLVALTALDVNLDYIRRITAAGFDDLPVSQLIAFKAQDIDPEYIERMKKLAGEDLSANEIVSFAALGITEKYVADMDQAGYKLSGNQLTEFKALGITPEYVKELDAYGLKDLDAGKIVELKAQNITPAFIESCKKMGFNDLSIDYIVQLRIFNIDKAYVDQIRAEGYPDITLDEIVQFKIFNIDKDFIKKTTDYLGRKPTPGKLVEMKAVGEN